MSSIVKKFKLPNLLASAIFLVSCSAKPISSTSQPQETKIGINVVSEISTPKAVSTESLTPSTESISASKTPAQTTVNWDKLPTLTEVSLSKSDFEQTDSWYSLFPLQESNVTNELKDLCLWDCAKFYFSNSEKRWTVILLRAGDNQKALNTAQNFKSNYEYTYEYTPDILKDMIPDSWVIIHQPADRYFISATIGASYGRIALVITVSSKTCFDTDEGFVCEGDLYSLANDASKFAKLQIKKLVAAGYPK